MGDAVVGWMTGKVEMVLVWVVGPWGRGLWPAVGAVVESLLLRVALRASTEPREDMLRWGPVVRVQKGAAGASRARTAQEVFPADLGFAGSVGAEFLARVQAKLRGEGDCASRFLRLGSLPWCGVLVRRGAGMCSCSGGQQGLDT